MIRAEEPRRWRVANLVSVDLEHAVRGKEPQNPGERAGVRPYGVRELNRGLWLVTECVGDP
jgi:hypothetical protein